MREEQHKTATLRSRLQEAQPQLKELTEVKRNLAALESARASLLDSLKQLEEDNNRMFIIKYIQSVLTFIQMRRPHINLH